MIAIDLGYCCGLSHVPSCCLAEEIQLLVERLGSMVSLCRQAAWRHRVVSSCSALLVSGRLAWAADMGRSCQAAWQGRWLHLAVKLLGGWV